MILVLICILSINIVSAEDIRDNSVDINSSQDSDASVDSNMDILKINESKISTEINIETILAGPESNVTIPINVESADGMPFNDNVTLILPDGTNHSVSIINGNGNYTWFIPEDFSGKYSYSVEYGGNDKYSASNSTDLFVVAPKIPVEIFVSNITAKPGSDVNIPITVVQRYERLFNGNVAVTLPDGITKIVNIVNGYGSVDWTVPYNYRGIYQVMVSFEGNNTHIKSNGTGLINVSDETSQSVVSKEEPTLQKDANIKTDDKATGNPLFVLFVVLALLAFNVRRKN